MRRTKCASLVARLLVLALLIVPSSLACDLKMLDDAGEDPEATEELLAAEDPGDIDLEDMSAVAAANGTTPFGPFYDAAGYTWGEVIWYNRSVRVTGQVIDWDDPTEFDLPYNQVRFRFFTAIDQVAIQTRTAEDEVRGFNFLQEGPRGGIREVEIELCELQNGCETMDVVDRP